MASTSSGSISFRNARILDGTGSEAVTGHVHVDGERIASVDDEPSDADRVIDLEQSFLAPGFIDMHSHSDLRLLEKPGAVEKLTQGVTTEVLGQDGVSVAPIPSDLEDEWAHRIRSLNGSLDEPWPWSAVEGYLDELEDAGPAVNCAYYAPHGNLRSLLTGFEDMPLADATVPADLGLADRDPARAGHSSDADALEPLDAVRQALERAIDHGAFGMSKGMIYPPSFYASDDELLALADALGDRNAIMVSHVWNETDHVVHSIERYLDICRRGGCHAHVSHLKVGGRANWGRSSAVLERFDQAEERGQSVSFDQYPYTAGSTMLTAVLPPWARQGNASDILERLRDETVRDAIATDISTPGEWENFARAAGTWENILITRTASGNHEGETVATVATNRDVDPVEAVCDLLLEEDLDVTMVDFIMAEADIDRFLADPRGSFCTDGIFGGKPHPRAIGTFPRILERYVRDRAVFSLAQMVFKAAGHPADILGFGDRGYVAEGYVADLVVFDLETVTERATYDDPWQLTDSLEYVLVGGEIAVEEGEPTGVRNGTVLRSTEEWEGPDRPTYSRGTC